MTMTRVLVRSPSIVNESQEGVALPASPHSDGSHDLVRRPINWRRGCIRLWIIGSALYVIAVAAMNHSELKTQFENFDRFDWVVSEALLVPMLCSDARGVMGKDFKTQAGDGETCWYELPGFRQRYPEYRGLSDTLLATKLYTAVDKPLPAARQTNSWATLLNWIGIFAAVPLIMLVVGAAIGWAFTGFTASTSPTSRSLHHVA